MTQERSAEETFGAQVRKAREVRGWTQERLRTYLRDASGIDLSSTAMARLEQGKRPIRLNEVAALTDLLDLSLTQYGGRSAQVSEQEYEELRARLTTMADQEYRLVDMLRRVDAEREALHRQVAEVRHARNQIAVTLAEYDRALRALAEAREAAADGQHQEAP
ncbi:helix-turn-helix domain-containing protein [Micromonospora rosaria]|uniref:helix-turn-helix domain-containing protein n=1 Tax=Micromonospora rosaria TaxID=47874 RepID=UPI0014723E20|nr:helix-turn-helix transcriptional regulator [Micromonospora rosaria]